MRNKIVTALICAALVIGGFALIPASPVNKKIGVYHQPPGPVFSLYDDRENKSGLRMAIEGRLTWLGVL